MDYKNLKKYKTSDGEEYYELPENKQEKYKYLEEAGLTDIQINDIIDEIFLMKVFQNYIYDLDSSDSIEYYTLYKENTNAVKMLFLLYGTHQEICTFSWCATDLSETSWHNLHLEIKQKHYRKQFLKNII